MPQKSLIDAILYTRDAALDGNDVALRRAHARGALIRLHRGAYIDVGLWRELTPWDKQLVRAHGAARAMYNDPILCRESAAVVWGLPVIPGGGDGPIHVLSSVATGTRSEGGVRRHATAHLDCYVARRHGVRTTDVVRTCAEFAASSTRPAAVALLDAALRGDEIGERCAIDREQIAHAAEHLGLWRGRGILRGALQFADAASGSPGESWLRVLIHRLGLPAPVLQHPFTIGGADYRVDFFWPEYGLVVEFDGENKYLSEELRGGRSAEEVVVAEKNREDAIRGLGLRVVRFVWADLRHPEALAARLRAAGLEGRRNRGRFVPDGPTRRPGFAEWAHSHTGRVEA